jgi:hypothetical protein
MDAEWDGVMNSVHCFHPLTLPGLPKVHLDLVKLQVLKFVYTDLWCPTLREFGTNSR